MEPKANPAAKAAAAQTENAAAQTEAKAKAAAAAAVPTVACCLVVKHENGQALTPPQADSFDPEDSRQVNFQQLFSFFLRTGRKSISTIIPGSPGPPEFEQI